MKQLIYHSRPFGFDNAMLAGILLQARRNNKRDDITGALICRHDLYIQLIEGPETQIDELYARIASDDRHCDIRLVHTGEVDERIFPDWAMLDDSMPTLTWSPAEVVGGAIEKASPAELLAIFNKVSVNVRT
ncbi:MAG: BLUF domain-containing protein [Erythrobacter sp.]